MQKYSLFAMPISTAKRYLYALFIAHCMDETLLKIKEFHGHLGPFAVIGYRMGLAANRELGESAMKKRAVVYSGRKTPMSCMIDGIQLSSGCTMGKGNISVEDKGEPRSMFSNREGTVSVEISLQEKVHDIIKEKMTSWEAGDQLAIMVYSMPEEELLQIRKL